MLEMYYENQRKVRDQAQHSQILKFSTINSQEASEDMQVSIKEVNLYGDGIITTNKKGIYLE